MKLYVAMVGLPARGKSTLAKRIRSGLEQQGIRTAIFNNGELRRMLFGLESGSAEFFNPDNTRAQRLRDQITHQNMERARAWLDEGGDVPYTYIPQNQYYHITITQRRKLFEMIRYA